MSEEERIRVLVARVEEVTKERDEARKLVRRVHQNHGRRPDVTIWIDRDIKKAVEKWGKAR